MGYWCRSFIQNKAMAPLNLPHPSIHPDQDRMLILATLWPSMETAWLSVHLVKILTMDRKAGWFMSIKSWTMARYDFWKL